jgi:hypothetical protein
LKRIGAKALGKQIIPNSQFFVSPGLFIAVTEAGNNLSKAAEYLYIEQPPTK